MMRRRIGVCWTRITAKSSELSGLMRSRLLLDHDLFQKTGVHFGFGIMTCQKIRGRRRGTPPPPIRPGPVGGHGEGRGQVVTSGDGLLHPSPGFAPPTGATIAG